MSVRKSVEAEPAVTSYDGIANSNVSAQLTVHSLAHNREATAILNSHRGLDQCPDTADVLSNEPPIQ
jgi:hypothetical protein